MRALIAILTISLASGSALAHPGGHSLVCKSAKKSGSNQVVELTLSRSNGRGWSPPSFSVTVDGTKHEFASDDEMAMFGETFHDAPLGVIRITANNDEDEEALTRGSFSVTAIPSTVKAYDTSGNRVKWRIRDEEDACHDTNGKAKFQALFRGTLSGDGVSDRETTLGAQILDCELEYDSGMSC